ncbi:hypothetical protein QAD02_004086 [Eretmocerus hayati]|uniref:Uncharacterized protein n=1 Tax=Eretmocerus hayati TaxID=131215 RepID=A0ACC2NPK4_9HYME|nr:hypothetical protein QAD02_004086 [Eretmocerus hayati]
MDHDLFEGIVPKNLYLAMQYLFKKKWIKPSLLNYGLNNIQFPNESKIFIPTIKINPKKKLTGSFAQISRLLRISPIAMVDHVRDENYLVWRMILELRQMPAVKVWHAKRQERRSVPYKYDAQLEIKDLIARDSIKLGIQGHKIVLEGDGTWIDDDESLECFREEILICLTCGEE